MSHCLLKTVSASTLILTVLILITVLSVLWTLPEKSKGCDELCLPCRSGDKSTLCCDCITQSLNSYLRKTFTTKYDEIKTQEEMEAKQNYKGTDQANPGQTSSETSFHWPWKEPSIQMKEFLRKTRWTIKPAARMTGTSQPKTRIYDRGMVPIRAWREGQRSFKRYGIRYRNGRLVVPIPGTYNIYSYLDLYESCITESLANCNESGSIVHDMVRYNIIKGEEEVLISNVHTHEVPQNEHFNIYDSYLTGVVTLEAGDEVFVRVSNLSYINSPSSNYFGVHMI